MLGCDMDKCLFPPGSWFPWSSNGTRNTHFWALLGRQVLRGLGLGQEDAMVFAATWWLQTESHRLLHGPLWVTQARAEMLKAFYFLMQNILSLWISTNPVTQREQIFNIVYLSSFPISISIISLTKGNHRRR